MKTINFPRDLPPDPHNDALNWVISVFDASFSGNLAFYGFSDPLVENEIANLSPDLLIYSKKYDYLMIIDIKTCRPFDIPNIPFDVESHILKFPKYAEKYSDKNFIKEVMNKFQLFDHMPKLLDFIIGVPEYCFRTFPEFNDIKKILESSESNIDFCVWRIVEYDKIKKIIGTHKLQEINELLEKGIKLTQFHPPEYVFFTLKSNPKKIAIKFLKILLHFSSYTGITEFTLDEMDKIIQGENPIFKNNLKLLYHIKDPKKRQDRWYYGLDKAIKERIMVYNENSTKYNWRKLDSSSQPVSYSRVLSELEKLERTW